MEEKRPSNIVALDYSLNLEKTIRSVFNCERGGMGGIAEANIIRSSPYLCMVATLTYLYKDKDIVTQGKIEKFIDDYSYYSNHRIVEIIEEVNEEEFQNIISDFEKIIG